MSSKDHLFLSCAVAWICPFFAMAQSVSLPELPPMPEVAPAREVNSVEMGDYKAFPEFQLNLPIAPGPFAPNWESIEKEYPGSPDWLREAKIGFWVHFGPQSSGESGDWYARNLYKEEHPAYKNHLSRFGHPSQVGYKEVLKEWNPTKLDPEALTALYHRSGARFLMIQGVHHDNYDLWNSRYHPWNSVNVGPHRDFLREWAEACRRHGMRYGVTFHHEYTWWWWQTAFGADKEGAYAGVPYDGHLTLADGAGKWWEGLDPRRLYGIDLREYKSVEEKAHTGWSPPNDGIFTGHLDYAQWFATQWALRIMDVVEHYDPDFIYTDGTVQGPFTGNGTGSGFKCNAMQTVMAHYFNRTLARRGEVNTFSIIKFRKPTNGAVNTAEFDFPDKIDTSQPWIRETPIGDWFYAPGFIYDAGSVIRFIIEAVCRDGNVALNIPMRPDGSIEEACVSMLEQVGQWLDVNGVAVYGSRAWHTLGEGEMVKGKLKKLPGGKLGRNQADFHFSSQDFRFTLGKDGALYAFTLVAPQPGETLVIKTLSKDLNPISSVRMLGHKGRLKWKQTSEGLEIICPKKIPCEHALVFRVETNEK